ncbi:MAG: hypothetical protein H6686_02070 [Fibrobacteria bacterium]|nr:hypothetical protein [Fibrobacteria bacterium]
MTPRSIRPPTPLFASSLLWLWAATLPALTLFHHHYLRGISFRRLLYHLSLTHVLVAAGGFLPLLAWRGTSGRRIQVVTIATLLAPLPISLFLLVVDLQDESILHAFVNLPFHHLKVVLLSSLPSLGLASVLLALPAIGAQPPLSIGGKPALDWIAPLHAFWRWSRSLILALGELARAGRSPRSAIASAVAIVVVFLWAPVLRFRLIEGWHELPDLVKPLPVETPYVLLLLASVFAGFGRIRPLDRHGRLAWVVALAPLGLVLRLAWESWLDRGSYDALSALVHALFDYASGIALTGLVPALLAAVVLWVFRILSRWKKSVRR